MEPENNMENKSNNPIVVSVIAYITLIGWLISAFILNKPKQPLCNFHIRQALGINLLFIVSGFVSIIPVLGWIAGAVGYILAIVLWVIGLIAAIQGEQKEVPVLGQKFQVWFQGL
ncbi:MAG: putative membrane protein [Saprospiraceae bacterium]|jgi:uncharacterized membrane protein